LIVHADSFTLVVLEARTRQLGFPAYRGHITLLRPYRERNNE